MKKYGMIILGVVLAALIAGGCVFWYQSATKVETPAPQPKPQTTTTEPVVEVEPPKEEKAIFSMEDYPRVDASLAIHPLVDSIASDFLDVPEEELSYEYTKTRTSDVYKNLIDGKVDVIFAAEPAEQDYEYAKEKGVTLNVIPVTRSAFVFIVNTQNPVDNLTLDEVVKIYKGDITNWKEVGGDDEEIIPYQRPNGSGSQTAMISLVMKDENLMTAPQMKVEGEMGGLVDAIAEYDNAKAAIGYSYFYYINTMYKRDTIKMLGINGVKPTIATIKSGEYPVATSGYIVTLEGIDKDSPTQKWVDAVLSSRGSQIIESAGYVPIN